MATLDTAPNPLEEFSSDNTWGAWAEVAKGSKADMVELCRRRQLHQKMISKAVSRMGHAYVILCGYDRRLNSVTLLGKDGGTVTIMLRSGNSAYQPRTRLPHISVVLDRIAEDYPDGTPTAAIAAALGDVLELWVRARHDGASYLEGRTVDELIAARLAPHMDAWLASR